VSDALDLRQPGKTEGYAVIRNIGLCHELVLTLIGAAAHLPRMGVFSGPSGFGKSFAAAFCSGEHRAYYVEVRSNWTRRALLLAILRQQGITPATTIYEMTDQVAEQLALSQRPLIIDECDHLIARGLVETVRDLFEQSQAPVVLIGEERLPQKLAAFERFHARILVWKQALPCNAQDARELARFYCPDVTVRDDLVQRLIAAARGSIRRVCVNLDRIAAFARDAGFKTVGAAEWAERELYAGQPPESRLF
jgi:DNA transposition AAA+ family ATPase